MKFMSENVSQSHYQKQLKCRKDKLWVNKNIKLKYFSKWFNCIVIPQVFYVGMKRKYNVLLICMITVCKFQLKMLKTLISRSF